MDLLKILSIANQLGLPQKDIKKITDLIEKLTTTYQTASTKTAPKIQDLRGSSTPKAGTLAYHRQALKDNKTQLSDTKQQIRQTKTRIRTDEKDLKKRKIENFWKLKNERKAGKHHIKSSEKHLRQQKRTLRFYQNKKLTLKNKGKQIRYTIQLIKSEAEQAKARLQAISASIKTQLQTSKTFIQMKTMFKTIDLKDPKYMPLIAFYNANANKKPSLDNPLPAIPAYIQAIISNEVKTIKKTKRNDKITGFTHNVATKYGINFTSSKEALAKAKEGALEVFHNLLQAPQQKFRQADGFTR